jgi:hypothetical protein
MSRKRLKEMLKREVESRIDSYSSKTSKSDDDKPLVKTSLKTELLGKPQEEIIEKKEVPLKNEQNEQNEQKELEKRYSFESEESDDSYSSESDSDKEINKYNYSSEEEEEDDYYKHYKRNGNKYEEPSRKQRDEEPARKQRDEEPARKQRDEEPARKQRDEEPARKQRYEEHARKQRDEEPARKQRDEEPARKQRDEEPARKQRYEEDKRVSQRKPQYEEEPKRKSRDEEPVRKPQYEEETKRKQRDEEPSRKQRYEEPKRKPQYDEDEPQRRQRDEEDVDKLFSEVPKKSFLQLIKSRNVSNISGDCVDELRDCLIEFLTYMFEQLSDSDEVVMTEASEIKTYMSFYLEDEDKELPQDLSIPTRDMEKGILNICDRFRVRIRKDVIYLVHMFAECILLKVVKGAVMINDIGKTKRLSGKEIRAAYKIYMM